MATRSKGKGRKTRTANKIDRHIFGPFYLAGDWKDVVKRAWSVRLTVVACILTGIEAGLPFLKELGYLEWLPGGVFALLTCIVVMAALAARLIAQEGLKG